jgi:outer membrane protein OmpA-like peptidoglycan-associated protein
MKVLLTSIFLFIFSITFGQTFTLKDSIVKKGDVLRGTIFFDYCHPGYSLNQNEITEESKPFLDSLGSYLIKNPKLRLEVSNHGDTKDSDCVDITQRRADSIAYYLINKHAIHPSRLKARGYGESKPIYSQFQINRMDKGKQEEAYSINRRTEFTIIEILK